MALEGARRCEPAPETGAYTLTNSLTIAELYGSQLEHIEPIEKLYRVIAEINRVSKAYYIIVPSIATPVEPHLGIPFWQLKDHNKKQKAKRINYFIDEAWLKFNGFSQALVKRQYYIPLLKQVLLIYKHSMLNTPQ